MERGIRYIFIKDRVDNGTVEVEYCPKNIMLADFFTKALQGAAFRKYRDVILGKTHVKSLIVEGSTNQGACRNMM